MPFSHKCEKNKLVSHSCIAGKKNLKLAPKIPHISLLHLLLKVDRKKKEVQSILF